MYRTQRVVTASQKAVRSTPHPPFRCSFPILKTPFGSFRPGESGQSTVTRSNLAGQSHTDCAAATSSEQDRPAGFVNRSYSYIRNCCAHTYILCMAHDGTYVLAGPCLPDCSWRQTVRFTLCAAGLRSNNRSCHLLQSRNRAQRMA